MITKTLALSIRTESVQPRLEEPAIPVGNGDEWRQIITTCHAALTMNQEPLVSDNQNRLRANPTDASLNSKRRYDHFEFQ